MIIYECVLTLLENTFFSSREINNFYQTEPLIGNYALSYALGLVNSPYHNNGEMYYYQHFSELNEKEIYVTPAKFIEKVKFSLTQFNSISDSYWSRMDNNAVAVDKSKVDKKANATNCPQIGWIKMLSIGNVARFYIISKNEVTINKYIRLGKFMSKAKIEAKKITFQLKEKADFNVNQTLNPLDILSQSDINNFDAFPINPIVLIDNVKMTGAFYECGEVNLPNGMKFGVDFLKDIKMKGKK